MLRSLARGVAKKRMKDKGIVHICKPNKGYGSYFANHWREYVYR